MKSVCAILAISFVFLSACNNPASDSKDILRKATEQAKAKEKPSNPAPVKVDNPSALNERNDQPNANRCKPIASTFIADKLPKSMGTYIIQKMEQVGECLRITIKHNGKTSFGNFNLIWDGAVMKSLPPIARLKLEGVISEEGGKPVVQELDFNLEVMKRFGKVVKVRLMDAEVDQVAFEFK